MSDTRYSLGDRVRLSALGKSRMMRKIIRHGAVVGFGLTESIVRVRFDGLGNPVSVHRSYIEQDIGPEIEAGSKR